MQDPLDSHLAREQVPLEFPMRKARQSMSERGLTRPRMDSPMAFNLILMAKPASAITGDPAGV